MNRRPYNRGGTRTRREGDDSAARAIQAALETPTPSQDGLVWKRMDLHLHTPASSDYRDPGISYVDILRRAEQKGIDIIAFADHNTVAGYAAMHQEIETLALLDKLGRATPDEREKLAEYRRLLAKIVVLPAFEFTATFGFHILGVFPENTSIRKLEYLLLNLNVPEEKMLAGAPDAGSTSDVLNAYAAIAAAGGMAIAAHANSSNGVAMQGFPFGGQTKIAYTQDPNLIALEVTDLEATGRRNTASFYNATKTEYPRRMHCIQGSDAHSLDTEQSDQYNKRLGVGARITEILVRDASFASIKEVLSGTDFGRTRPYRSNPVWEAIGQARERGANMTQSFHERAVTHTSRTRPILHDVIAFANGEGGTVYVGANPDTNVPVHGLENAESFARMLAEDIEATIEPALDVDISVKASGDRSIIVIEVPRGEERPYIFSPAGQIYVRDGASSTLARRSDIVSLVLEANALAWQRRTGQKQEGAQAQPAAKPATPSAPQTQAQPPAKEEAGPSYARTPARPTVTTPTPATPQIRVLPGERLSGRAVQSAAAQQPATPSVEKTKPQAAASIPQSKAKVPNLRELAPEKIKGQVRPMPGAAPAGVEEPRSVPPEQAQQTTPSADEWKVSGRRGGRARAKPESVEAAAQAPKPKQAAAEETKAPAPASGRGSRSRRKSAEPAEAAVEVDTPMEATVSAEHLTREEIVEETKPKRGRRGSTKKEKELEIEAPAAAAAATEAGMESILAEAQMEAPALADLPSGQRRARGGTSRRKAGAQVEAEAQEAQPAAAEPGPEAGRKSRAKRGKAASAEGAAIAAPDQESPDPPKTGVEITKSETRNNTQFHTVHNLIDGSMVHNVTRKSTRGLWNYAVVQQERGAPELSEVLWHTTLPIGLWRREHRAGAMRYDFVSRTADAGMRVYYGVTDEGIWGPWQEVVALAEAADWTGPKIKE